MRKIARKKRLWIDIVKKNKDILERIIEKRKIFAREKEMWYYRNQLSLIIFMKHTTTLVKKAYNHTLPLIEKHCGKYPFHNQHHTKWVFERSTYLGLSENLGYDELEDLQIASLFHDIGFLEQYPKNEYIGSQIARKWLEEQSYPEERIQKIENMIMATVLFSQPKNILEEIIQDSDLDNIGTKDSFECSRALFREIREIAHVEVQECVFWQFTYKVHKNFHFHTHSAQKERNRQLSLNLKHLNAYLQMLECEIPEETGNLERIV